MCQNILYITGKKDLDDFVSKSKDGKFTLSTYYPYDERISGMVRNIGGQMMLRLESIWLWSSNSLRYQHPNDVAKTTNSNKARAKDLGDTIGPEIELSFDTPGDLHLK